MTGETARIACESFETCANCGGVVVRNDKNKLRCLSCRSELRSDGATLAPSPKQIEARAAVLKELALKKIGLIP